MDTMKERKRKFTEWVECASKFETEPKEPLCMQRQTKVFRAGSIGGMGTFGHSAHTTWEEF